MRISFIFAWYDLWIGFFWDQKKKWLYFFPFPTIGLIFKFNCQHKKTHNEDWPDGGIEVCDKCGMSRHIWEQGESEWLMVNIPKARKELQESIDSITQNVKKVNE